MSSEESEQAESETSEAEESGIREGDFVRLDYTARTVEGEQLVDTTDQEVAEEEGVEDQQESFEPRIIAVGAGHIFDTVEEDFIGGETGAAGTVTVPAPEAFGEYDEGEVRTVSADRIPEDDRYPGGHVDIDGEHGHVETIIGGRARVDFNHPLAGEDIEYDYEVLDTVEDRLERAQGMLGMYFDVDLDMRIETDEVEEEQMVEPEEPEESEEDTEDEPPEPEFETVTTEKETLYIEQSPQLQFNQQWMMGKQQILGDLIDRLDLDRVIVEEVIDGSGGMMGGMGGMMGGMGGGGGEADLEAIEEELEDAEVDVDDITDELDEGEADSESEQ